MAVYFECKYTAGQTLFATVKRLSDGYRWSVAATAFQAAPTLADSKITLTEGSSEYAGTYSGSVAAMGSPGEITTYFHDDSLAGDVPFASVNSYVRGNNEVSTAYANEIADGAVDADAIASDAITAAKIANGAIDAATFAADVDAEILSYLVDDATRIDASSLNTASATTIPAIVADTNELQTDWANGGRLDVILDARSSQTSVDDLPTNAELATALASADDATLAAIAALNNLSSAQAQTAAAAALTAYDPPTNAEMEARTIAAASYATASDQTAIKAKTDQLVFTVANNLNCNVQYVNDVGIIGDGSATPFNVV